MISARGRHCTQVAPSSEQDKTNFNSLTASSMSSWSYQATNPCTVLVNEKQDGQSPMSRDCPPPSLPASTETSAPSHDQPEISSSLGNSIGGKKKRAKRDTHEDGVVDVVFDDGVGHEFKSRNETEKRILVNISIAMDSGLGSAHQAVYQLQVAVPLPKEKMNQEFFLYDVEKAPEEEMNADSPSTTPSTDPTDESSTTNFDELITSSTSDGGLRK